jgi:hypothetical protein
MTPILHRDTKTSDSPDTPYKIALTKWIEKKKWFEAYERIKDTDAIHKGNPYSIFEAWQKVCPIITEEGEG